MLGTGCSEVVLAPRTLVLLHPGRLNKPGHKGMALVVVFAGWVMGVALVEASAGQVQRSSFSLIALEWVEDGVGDSVLWLKL